MGALRFYRVSRLLPTRVLAESLACSLVQIDLS
jgi:hypothetical protein